MQRMNENEKILSKTKDRRARMKPKKAFVNPNEDDNDDVSVFDNTRDE